MQRASFTFRVVRLVPLAALVAAGGCFATRSDVRLVQSDMASMRTELLKGQSDQKQELTQAIRTLAVASDSVRAMSNRLTAVQGDVRGGLRNVNDQLIQVQELLRQSAATITKLRSQNEQLYNQPAPPPASGVGMPDSVAAMVPQAPQSGPAQLYESGSRNLQRNSTSTARSAFQELLTNFPTSDLAPQAQLGIGQSYQQERKFPEAQAAFATVYQRYPQSPAAPTALYKSGKIYQDQGSNAQAKALYQQIVAKYRGSDEFDLATDALKILK
jgi:tol-pal system protein YbgF